MSHTYNQIKRRRLNVVATIVVAMACVLLLPDTTSAQWATNGTNINSTNTGNVGIGTTAPNNKLVVEGGGVTGLFGVDVSGPNPNLILKLRDATNGYYPGISFQNTDGSSIGTIFGSRGSGLWFDSGANQPLVFRPSATEVLRLMSNGDAGFGTSSPASLGANIKALDIRGGAGAGIIFGVGGGGASKLFKYADGHTYADYAGGDFIFTAGATEKLRLTNSGALKLSYNGADAYSSPAFMSGGYAYGGLVLSVNSYFNPAIGTYTVPLSSTQSNWSIHMNSSNASGTGLVGDMFAIKRAPATTGTPAHVDYFNIAWNGNVGLGTSSPAEKLSVVGNITATGNITSSGSITAKYQDVAEYVKSSRDLAAGTVVVVEGGKSNQVTASINPYDTKVAGVISLQPGLILGEGGEGRVLVATTGRVKIRVDATNAAIKAGDLLVTSDKEGVAMKSVPLEVAGTQIHRPGTLIGKALEDLETGMGEILVLLSLQ